MRETVFAERGQAGESFFPLSLCEFDHRVRNLLNNMELAVRQEPPSNAEEYRAKLMKPVLDFASSTMCKASPAACTISRR